MDKGLWILYLGVGIVEWIEAPRENGQPERVSSPVILVPVKLVRESAQTPYRLLRADEDAAVNPALAFKLQHDFGISIPPLEDDQEEDIDQLMDAVRDSIAEQEDWTAHNTVVLSLFSFHKEVMYRDLLNNEAAIAANPLVQGLALGHRADQNLAFDPTPEDELDEKHPPEAMISILDCDASQRQCLVAAAEGKSFVMEGPPGTGKSQTIANMIADALGHNRTVLFVSEKAAALEVVQNRLHHAGLSEFVLELHSHKATRKQVAQALGRSLTTRLAPTPGLPEVELQRLVLYRQDLTAYARAMNEQRSPLGRSVHNVVGELSQLQHLPQAPGSATVDDSLAANELAKIYETTEALAGSWGPVRRGDDFLWHSLRDGTLTQSRRASLVGTLERAMLVVEGLEGCTRELAETTGLSWRDGIPDASRFGDLLSLLETPRNVPSSWLSIDSLASVNARREELGRASRNLDELTKRIEADAGDNWRDLKAGDLGHLESSLSSLRRSPLSFLLAGMTGLRAGEALGICLREVAASARRGLEAVGPLAAVMESPIPQTVAELHQLLELGALVFSPHKPDAAWLEAARQPEILSAINALEQAVATVQSGTATVERLFKSSILGVDVDGLWYRFDQIHHGLGKLLPAYWRDKRALRDHTKSGKVRREEIEGLRGAIECKRRQKALATLESRHGASIGRHYYKSLNSDFGAIRSAFAVADAVVKHAAGQIAQGALSQRFSLQADRSEDVVRAFSGMRQWHGEFVAKSARLSVMFERLASERKLDELVVQTETAAGDIERINETLSRVARALRLVDVPMEAALRWLLGRLEIEDLEHQFSDESALDHALLGPLYKGQETDFREIDKDLVWVERIRSLVEQPLSVETTNRILHLDVAEHRRCQTYLAEWSHLATTIISQFESAHQAEVRAELETAFADVKGFIEALATSIDDISEWGSYSEAMTGLSGQGLEPSVAFCIQKRIPATDVPAVIRRSALESWLDSVCRKDSRLRKFFSKDRDHIAQAFKELDRRLIEVAVASAIDVCNSRRPTVGAGAAGLIATEANKQKRHMPIRRLIEQAAPVVQALKPCMMMSPLSVSQFLPPSLRFDLVIFDEASQVKPADAINCIYRGRQLVIAGDQKQLPPTPFFDRLDADSGDDWEEDQLEEYESVLDVAKGSGVLRAMALRWHYRSQHEDLITYSNYSFYDGSLVTFPSANTHGPDVGVELFVVPGVYRRGGARDNPIEATKVVERVLFHIREHPQLSIGVVAFSEAQASTIENEILRRSGECPELRVMLDGDRLHGGFVKNLESVQGDERDIIIFSIGYGRDELGRFTLNFGPLNKPGGHRRLNVAITRARRRVEVISSVEAADFLGDLRSEGVRHLRRYLDFAARSDNRLAALGVELSPEGRDCESPFEEEVARVIRSWGYEVVPQVGCADYRIDLAVKHTLPGHYALGIECDGAMYHSSRVARDRDRLRQDVLARLGWTNLHRIWGLSWYWNRGQEEIRLRRAIEGAIEGRANVAPQSTIQPLEPEELTIELSETPEWVVPYRVVLPGRPRTDAAMHESAAQGDLQRMINEVVRGEGPVAIEVVLRRVRSQWGMNRVGSRARSAFDSAVRSLKRKGEIVTESDGFLVAPNRSAPLVRGASQGDPDTIRNIYEIPPSEIKETIIRFIREVHAISEDELTARVSAVFGWNRRGADIASEFRKIIRKLAAAGVIRRNGDSWTGGGDT
jgi:hypothetical protein